METGAAQQGSAPNPAKDRLRYFTIMGVLAIAAITVTSYLMVWAGVFGPQYPDEETPLELNPWGISLTRDFTRMVDGEDGYPYECYRVELGMYEYYDTYRTYTELGLSAEDAPLVNLSEFSPPETLDDAEEYLGIAIGPMYSDPYNATQIYCIFIDDDEQDGRYGNGDSIYLFRFVYLGNELIQVGFDEDDMRKVILKSEYSVGLIEISCAFVVHDGRLYSWYCDPRPW